MSISVSLHPMTLFLNSCSCLWFFREGITHTPKKLSTVDLEMFSFFFHSKGWVRRGIQNDWNTILHQCFSSSHVAHYFILLQFACIWTSFFQEPEGYDSLINTKKFHKYFLLLEHCFSTLPLLETPKKKWGNYTSAILLLNIEVPGDFHV